MTGYLRKGFSSLSSLARYERKSTDSRHKDSFASSVASRRQKAVFRATAITGELPRAGMAFLRHRAAFIETKLLVLRAIIHLTQRRVVNIAELILRVNEMIAVIHIAIHFHCKSATANGRKNANLRGSPHHAASVCSKS